jgi:hypothetical protein
MHKNEWMSNGEERCGWVRQGWCIQILDVGVRGGLVGGVSVV